MAAGESSSINPIVIWEPQTGPQTALLSCPVFEVFFGGARGGGKTDGMLGEWASHAGQYGDKASGLMVRRSRTELSDTIKRSKRLYGPLGAKFKEQEKEWHFPDGAVLKFAYLENDSDAENYQGHSYTRVYIEEIGNFPKEEPVLKLMATLRSAEGVPTGFRATGNPGGPGHMWVKARYVDIAPGGWVVKRFEFENPFNGEKIIRDRVYIPSRLSDNPRLLLNDPAYVANLQMQGSPELVKAWLEGDWDVIAGTAFEKLSRRIHMIRPFNIPRHWAKFTSLDWGTARPYSHGWYAINDEDVVLKGREGNKDQVIAKGSIIRYRELYGWTGKADEGSRNETWQVAQKIAAIETGVNVDALIERIDKGEDVSREIKKEYDSQFRREKHELIDYRIGDSAMWAEHDGPSAAENFQKSLAKCGITPHSIEQSRKDRTGNYLEARNRISQSDGEHPGFYVFSNCVHFWRTVPDLQLDEKHPEKGPDTNQEDHVWDEVSYALVSRPKLWTRVEREDLDYEISRRKAFEVDRGHKTGRYS